MHFRRNGTGYESSGSESVKNSNISLFRVKIQNVTQVEGTFGKSRVRTSTLTKLWRKSSKKFFKETFCTFSN